MTEHTTRIALTAGAIALALLSIGAGALIALSDDRDRSRPASSPSSGTPGAVPTATGTASASAGPAGSASPEPSASRSPVLPDGRHFVYVDRAARLDDGSMTLTFDLAYFYRGERAEQEAAERGDGLVNEFYIVNDNPRLRTLALADDVEVAYIPTEDCCDLQPGDIDSWLGAVAEESPTDYGGRDVPWWLTIEGGEITRIEQQYLP